MTRMTGTITTFTSSEDEFVNIAASDPLTECTISLAITLERAEEFANELLVLVANRSAAR